MACVWLLTIGAVMLYVFYIVLPREIFRALRKTATKRTSQTPARSATSPEPAIDQPTYQH